MSLSVELSTSAFSAKSTTASHFYNQPGGSIGNCLGAWPLGFWSVQLSSARANILCNSRVKINSGEICGHSSNVGSDDSKPRLGVKILVSPFTHYMTLSQSHSKLL